MSDLIAMTVGSVLCPVAPEAGLSPCEHRLCDHGASDSSGRGGLECQLPGRPLPSRSLSLKKKSLEPDQAAWSPTPPGGRRPGRSCSSPDTPRPACRDGGPPGAGRAWGVACSFRAHGYSEFRGTWESQTMNRSPQAVPPPAPPPRAGPSSCPGAQCEQRPWPRGWWPQAGRRGVRRLRTQHLLGRNQLRLGGAAPGGAGQGQPRSPTGPHCPSPGHSPCKAALVPRQSPVHPCEALGHP